MKILVIYDSLFGNTKKIAEAIFDSLLSSNKIRLVNAVEVTIKDLEKIDMLIVGSPTHGGRAKQNLQTFLDQLPNSILKGTKVAVFDTRFLEKDQTFLLRLLLKTIGYAAPKIAKNLKNKGGNLIVEPEGFIVKRKEGPLAEGELERAKSWGEKLKI